MILRFPTYFEHFRCIAAACPDSCCQQWDVLVDEDSAETYLTMDGSLGQALQQHLKQDEEGWFFEIVEGRCPFWQDDGLCRIQTEAGHGMLCKTCRDFPRLCHDYGDFVEKGLSLSCPEAARLILSAQASHWEERDIPGGEEPEYDSQDMAVLLRTREVMLTILSDERYTVPQALALGLLYGYTAQGELDSGEALPFDPAAQLAMASELAKGADTELLRAFYSQLEILTDTWKALLENPQGNGTWAPELRAMARYGVERYWLQAVSDWDLAARVKMVVAGCILVHLLGGDVTRTAQLYAKEIENDEDNVEAILDGAYTAPALTDVHLLALLLGENS